MAFQSAERLTAPIYATLALLFAFAIVSGSLGANADAKSIDTTNSAQAAAPPGVVVTVNTDDVFDSGIVFVAVSFFTAVHTAFFAVCTFCLPFARSRTALRLQAILTAFSMVFIMAALIAFDVFVANRSAKVTAMLGSITLSPDIIAQLQQEAGISPVYWDQTYLRAPAIVPWFEVLFGFISSFLLFRASNRVVSRFPSSSLTRGAGPATDAEMGKEEEPVMQERGSGTTEM